MPGWPAEGWEEELWYQATFREAHRLILGKDPVPSAGEVALTRRARAIQAERETTGDEFARLVRTAPRQPRLWIGLGRRLGELGRWDEAAPAFARASMLGRNSPQVWKEMGRTYAELGHWDEAAAQFVRVLDALSIPPIPEDRAGSLAWFSDRHGIDDAIVRHSEVYLRLARLRPKDLALVARRMLDLVGRGMFLEAADVQETAVQLIPESVAARELLDQLRLRAGDVPGHRAPAQDLLGRIPKAPAVASVGSLAREAAARRERKGRAVHLSAREGLALIRLDIGQRAEAEAELRAVLAERVKIAAEEPANPDFQADLAATNQQLGRLLAEGGKVDTAKPRR